MAIQQRSVPIHEGKEQALEEPTPRLFTVDEYYKMAEAGILRPDERVQLIEGRIIQMPSIGPRHAYDVTRLTKFLRARLGDDVEIRSQNPIQLADGALPEPDIAVVTLHPSDLKAYELRHPVPAESLLVVEVADTTLGFDLGEKARMYALHEVQDYWVVDLTGHRVIVHRNPTAAGYASVRVVESGGELNLVSFPGVAFTADEILG